MRAPKNCMTVLVNWCLMLVVTMILLVPASVALAENYDIDYLTWKNNGAYRAHVKIKVKDKNTGKVKIFGNKCFRFTPSGTFTGEENWFNSDESAECSLFDIANYGDEVWLVIEINGGDTKSCRKSSKLFYSRQSRKFATFSSGGTSLNNNRCKSRGVKSP